MRQTSGMHDIEMVMNHGHVLFQGRWNLIKVHTQLRGCQVPCIPQENHRISIKLTRNCS